ncbi:hypothetical protein [uncultured Agathobaculum sp.]|uniref:hypothetical protein n=1 Tax=uncultured Agathobaculum sp. TaxID=2048140 RepID=UPI00296F1D4B
MAINQQFNNGALWDLMTAGAEQGFSYAYRSRQAGQQVSSCEKGRKTAGGQDCPPAEFARQILSNARWRANRLRL